MDVREACLAWAARLAALTPASQGRWLILATEGEPAAVAVTVALAGRSIEWPPAFHEGNAGADFDGVVIGQGGLVGSGLDEVAQAVKPGGVCGVAAHLAPEDEKAAEYLNALLALRKPTQAPLWARETWERALFAAGLLLIEHSVAVEALDFDDWAGASPPVTALNRVRLRAMLQQAPRTARAYLTPTQRGDRITFHLHTGFLISRRPTLA